MHFSKSFTWKIVTMLRWDICWESRFCIQDCILRFGFQASWTMQIISKNNTPFLVTTWFILNEGPTNQLIILQVATMKYIQLLATERCRTLSCQLTKLINPIVVYHYEVHTCKLHLCSKYGASLLHNFFMYTCNDAINKRGANLIDCDLMDQTLIHHCEYMKPYWYVKLLDFSCSFNIRRVIICKLEAIWWNEFVTLSCEMPVFLGVVFTYIRVSYTKWGQFNQKFECKL